MTRKFDYSEALEKITVTNPNIRFRRFRIWSVYKSYTPQHTGDVTIAYTDNDKGVRHMALAFRSPRDKYNKAYGQFLAASRLLHKDSISRGHLNAVHLTERGDKISHTEQMKAIILNTIARRNMRWAMEHVDII
jgi:hypothetical protein